MIVSSETSSTSWQPTKGLSVKNVLRKKVTADGLLIPSQLLEGVEEVDICREATRLVVVPVPTEDPILQLGAQPIDDPVEDASVNHDRYLYG